MAELGGTCVDDHADVRTCSICMEDFKTPKLLPCFHTFCLGCLQRLTSGVAAGKQFPCPVCRYLVSLPCSGPPGFQTNFYIQAAKTRRDFHGTVCKICSKPATCRCKECEQSLCEDCAKVHNSLTSSKSHSLIRLLEISKCRPAIINPEFCTKHVDERLRFHCKKCEKPICRDCKMTSHEGHTTVDLEDVVNEGRNTLAKVKDVFVKLETTFQKKEKKVKDQIQTFSKLIEKMKNDIDREADDVITKTNIARESRKMEIEQLSLAEMNCFNTTEKTIHQDILFLKSNMEYISMLITSGCGADIMKSVKDMNDILEQFKTDKEKRKITGVCRTDITKEQSEIHYALVICGETRFRIYMSEPVALEVVTDFQCSTDGSPPDVISPVGLLQAWVAVKARSGNGYVRLFTEGGVKMKEFVIHKAMYSRRREGGVLNLIPCSDTEKKCQEIDGFRSGIKLKHKPKMDTSDDSTTCTVNILNQCVTVVNNSCATILKLSCGVGFAPVDVCWGPDGKIVIVDRASNSILMYKRGDTKMSSFVCGRRKKFRPCAVAWDGGRLWIGDLSGRVFVCENHMPRKTEPGCS